MNRKLKIAYIGWAHSIHLQRVAKWFIDRGHQVDVFSDTFRDIPGVRVQDIHMPTKYFWTTMLFQIRISYIWISYLCMILKIRKGVRDLKPDILHICTLYMPAQLGLFANFKPLVVMPWNGDIIWKQNRSFLHKYIIKRSFKLADAIPLQTEYLKERCIELGAAEDKIEIVQFGVEFDLFKFNMDMETLKRELRLNTDNVVISTRNIHYNIMTIVESIPLVIKSIPDGKFIFMWPNTEKESSDIIKRIKDLGIEASVRIIGCVSNHGDIAKYLSLAKTFVSVSEIDCFPQTGLEAMAMKVFPVMSNLAPIRVYIKDRVNGILVNPVDVNSVAIGIIDSLKLDGKKRNEVVEYNYKLVREKADFNKEMSKLENLYYRLVEK